MQMYLRTTFNGLKEVKSYAYAYMRDDNEDIIIAQQEAHTY
jgi:hypothetical protein